MWAAKDEQRWGRVQAPGEIRVGRCGGLMAKLYEPLGLASSLLSVVTFHYLVLPWGWGGALGAPFSGFSLFFPAAAVAADGGGGDGARQGS